MDLQLHKRIALVTGGASGIGLACVEALLAEGASVLIVDRNPAGADVARDFTEAGHTVAFVQADVTSETQVQEVMAYARDRFNGLDIILGCAGISGPVGQKSTDISLTDWDQVMAVNVKGQFIVAKHAVKLLEESNVASVVFLASDAALVAFEGMTPYCTSKGAVLMLTKSLSVDHPQIRFNCVCPGVVDTPMSRRDLGCPNGFSGSELPVMQAHQIARHAVFLASPVSAPINGTSLVADFGYLARSALPELAFS
ncbi:MULTISPECIES: SDR family NAD(P)-dependent oxidoreductase [unclassified Salinicola]|uniref:SDR family NAD(P)-dependent oxidoreductase n=1 Tax=unclassified Salinicola TaxID=2634022 RepID=UPI001A8FC507|nr:MULTISPECIES: SDR family oxidoreductase [unclassified Salinicola]MCE3028884.1 SDR family oxidoreductase [Salinicola sp. DM10]WIX34404.1 SDR family oxidoreductase [Salinicola sp. JS01]